MPLFLDLFDNLFKRSGQTQQDRAIDSSSVLSVGDSSIALRLPNTTQSAQVASRVFRNLGNENTVAVDTDPTVLNLEGLLQERADGGITVDFTSLGGQVFNGTREELAQLSGGDLLSTIGNAAAQNTAGGTLGIGGNTTPQLLGGQSRNVQTRTANLSQQNANASTGDLNSLLKNIGNEEVSQSLTDKLLSFSDDESDELLKLFRAANAGG